NRITAIQAENRICCSTKSYQGQMSHEPSKANVRYEFLPSDTSRLYRMHHRIQGIDLLQPPEYNLHGWLDPLSPNYQVHLASAIFYYKSQVQKSERLRVCIQTDRMKEASWKYGHQKQIMFDGTFGVANSRVLLFIVLAIDETKKGVPLAFLFFSAPTGNRATQAGYDSAILTELLKAWVEALGKNEQGETFTPKAIITDTDAKERLALNSIWPSILLLLCKFHVRTCWTNKRKTLIKSTGEKVHWSKQQVITRLRLLETR
ncbi:MAG TPA: hypothetical protein VGO47_10870, partial [Chlamydiales bacterium]|nr:hypothetical protein [Chlamydiales bacterium]